MSFYKKNSIFGNNKRPLREFLVEKLKMSMCVRTCFEIYIAFSGWLKFLIGDSKFNLWFLRSIHFWLINFWRLGEYWFFGWWYWKHPNFQLVTVKNLIFSCPEKDGKMTNRHPWKIQTNTVLLAQWLSDLGLWYCWSLLINEKFKIRDSSD